MHIQHKSANRQVGLYFLTLIICCIPALGLLWAKGYEASFLWLNSFHHPIVDALMPHFTHIGEGAFMTALFVIIIRKKQPAVAVALAISMLLVLAIVSPLKHNVFEAWGRPLAYFDKETIHYVGLREWRSHAFPSGHSAAAACMFAFFALAWQRPQGAMMWGILAALTAYSRVYLGVHFVGDILFGAGIGMFISAVVYGLFYNRLVRYFEGLSAQTLTRWQLALLVGGLITLAISLYELIRTYYVP